MSLSIKVHGQTSSVYSLTPAAFVGAGYLGGSIAALGTVDNTVVACDLTKEPIGLFSADALGNPWENTPAVASNKLTIVKGLATVEVDVFETVKADNSGALVYSMGQKLYSSAKSLLTNEESTSKVVIGKVNKVPTTSSPTLGVEMAI